MFFASLQPLHWVFIGIGIFVLVSLLFGVWITFETARRVYLHTLSTKMGGDWKRVCSAPDNPAQMKMWNDGIEFMSQYQDKKEDVSPLINKRRRQVRYIAFAGSVLLVLLIATIIVGVIAFGGK